MKKIKKAIISVSNKKNLYLLLKNLAKFKIQLISSDIQNTQLDVSVDGYEFIEITEKNGYFKIKCGHN